MTSKAIILATAVVAAGCVVAAGKLPDPEGFAAGETRTITTVATFLDGRKETREHVVPVQDGTLTFRLAADAVGTGVKTLEVRKFPATRKGGMPS